VLACIGVGIKKTTTLQALKGVIEDNTYRRPGPRGERLAILVPTGLPREQPSIQHLEPSWGQILQLWLFALQIHVSSITFKSKTMKHSKAIVAVLISIGLKGQSIYSVNYESQADVKVFVVQYESQADLKVYKVDYQSQVKGNEGLWYFVDYKSQSDKTIHFVKYESQADVKIFFVKYQSQAGWRNSSKKHFFY